MRKIIFKAMFAPGDILMLNTAVRELHRHFPGLFITDIVSPYPEITYNTPYLTKLIKNGMKDPQAIIIDVNYSEELNRSHETNLHFAYGFWLDILKKLDLPFNPINIYPNIYLTDEEKNKQDIRNKYSLPKKFWLLNASIKNDMPLKSWIITHWQEVINKLKYHNINVVQVGTNKAINPMFDNIYSLIDQTECLREFLKICNLADGAITHVSLLHHIMAAYKKSWITISGGREINTWEQYPFNNIYLHSIGKLKCCRTFGCHYKQRYECLNMNKEYDFPECMVMISVEDVVKSVLKLENNNGI